MKWKDFITPIYESKITIKVSWMILSDLFIAAGCKCEFSDSAVRSWLSGRRKCKVSTYFPDNEVNIKEVYSYFRRRPDSNLKQLQELFQKKTSSNSDSPINLDTEDLDVFCWSLVNQFLDLLGFQRIDIPHATPSGEKTAEDSHALDSQTTKAESDVSVSKQDTEQLEVGTIPNEVTASDLSPNGGVAIPIEGRHSIRSSILPHSDSDCCYHCVYWDGDRETVWAYMNATYGPCRKYSRKEQLSSDPACKDYKKRKKLSGEWWT